MIDVMELILGYEWGTTSYDDILASGAFVLALSCILLVINIFKSFVR